jgi:hypothetical protein
VRYGVGNVFADEPDLLESSGAEAFAPDPEPDETTDAQNASPWKPNPPPSFTSELRRFSTIDRDYDESDQWTPIIDKWIEDVRVKLEGWNPRNAERFMSASTFTNLALTVTAGISGRSDISQYPELRRLHSFRNRLREIVDQ